MEVTDFKSEIRFDLGGGLETAMAPKVHQGNKVHMDI